LSSYDPYGDKMYVFDQLGEADELDVPTMGTLWLSHDVISTICSYMLVLCFESSSTLLFFAAKVANKHG
jgi:hypothetical protein